MYVKVVHEGLLQHTAHTSNMQRVPVACAPAPRVLPAPSFTRQLVPICLPYRTRHLPPPPLLSRPAGPAGEDYVVLPSPPGPITQQLQQLVQQLQEATPVADWQ